jgi:hypothetical protein
MNQISELANENYFILLSGDDITLVYKFENNIVIESLRIFILNIANRIMTRWS